MAGLPQQPEPRFISSWSLLIGPCHSPRRISVMAELPRSAPDCRVKMPGQAMQPDAAARPLENGEGSWTGTVELGGALGSPACHLMKVAASGATGDTLLGSTGSGEDQCRKEQPQWKWRFFSFPFFCSQKAAWGMMGVACRVGISSLPYLDPG